MRYADEAFKHQTIELDGNTFHDCTFDRCKLIFRAYDQIFFTRCLFTECDWTFGGPAETMLFFLQDLYHGLGFSGRELVDAMIVSIKAGTFPEMPTPKTTVVR